MLKLGLLERDWEVRCGGHQSQALKILGGLVKWANGVIKTREWGHQEVPTVWFPITWFENPPKPRAPEYRLFLTGQSSYFQVWWKENSDQWLESTFRCPRVEDCRVGSASIYHLEPYLSAMFSQRYVVPPEGREDLSSCLGMMMLLQGTTEPSPYTCSPESVLCIAGQSERARQGSAHTQFRGVFGTGIWCPEFITLFKSSQLARSTLDSTMIICGSCYSDISHLRLSDWVPPKKIV